MSHLEIKIFFHKLADLTKLVTFPLFKSSLYISRNDPWIVKNYALAKVEITLFLHITWSHDQWVTWLGGWDTLTLNHRRATELKNGKKNMYYKLGQLYYSRLGQVLLQVGAAITNWGNRYNKIGQLLQIGAKCITNWAGITN